MQEEETVNTNHCSVRIWQGQGLGFDAHHHLFHTKEKVWQQTEDHVSLQL